MQDAAVLSCLRLACCNAVAIPVCSDQDANYVRTKDVKVRVEKQIGKHILSMETGLLARQAGGAVVTQYGGTVVLSAVTSGEPRQGIDFFPLMCDYRERGAAVGRLPGGSLKREGRPTMKVSNVSRGSSGSPPSASCAAESGEPPIRSPKAWW